MTLNPPGKSVELTTDSGCETSQKITWLRSTNLPTNTPWCCTLQSLRGSGTCEISSSWFTLDSMTNSVSSSVGRTLLRYHVGVALPLSRHWALAHHCVTRSSALCCARGVAWATHSLLTVVSTGVLWGVNRDPPVWPSTQAGWWKNQSASPTYVGDELRFQGHVDYRRVFLHPSSTCSCSRSGRLRDHVTERSHPPLQS